jgi:hypothetical protein
LAIPACEEVRCSLYAKGVDFKRAAGCRTQVKYAAIYKGEGRSLKETELRNFREWMAKLESWKELTTLFLGDINTGN